MLWHKVINAGPAPAPAGWDISNASFSQSFSVSAQDTDPRAIFIKPDGTKMYILGNTGKDVNEYDLSTAWDVSSASYVRNFALGFGVWGGLFFETAGTKMYVLAAGNRRLKQYALGTAWDISTATLTFNIDTGSLGESNPSGVSFKPDGTKMYITGFAGDDVNEYDVGTAWNISTLTFVQNFSVSAQTINPNDLFFKPDDGTKMYVIGTAGTVTDAVHQYDLSTGWDISTASFVQSFVVQSQENTPEGLFFKSDGTRMYVVGRTADAVLEYTL